MIPNFEKIEFVEFLSKNPKRIYEGGNRFKNLPRKRNDPLISIITVSKNSSKFVKETLDSIKNQKYENIEYIVIDGASSDGTIDIIKENIDFIDYFVSEPDLGNYDAINKGLSENIKKGLEIEADIFAETFSKHKDAEEGITSFLNKAKPDFSRKKTHNYYCV